MSKQKKLGIIQSRGLGDIMIALPIAKHYADNGYEIYWPICEQWVEQMNHYCPWIKWIPVTPDTGEFFYDIPMERLKNFKVNETLCLYQSLTGHPDFTEEPFFQHTSFDRYKYLKAGVPFLNKWKLAECITRDAEREQAMFDKVVKNKNYVVTHLTASWHNADFDQSSIPNDWQIIPITNDGYVLDWLKVIEEAECVVMTDSVMANIVDQLNIGQERYFLPCNHIQLTPVFGNDWIWLENKNIDPKVKIFRST